jgi:hypothetical protein
MHCIIKNSNHRRRKKDSVKNGSKCQRVETQKPQGKIRCGLVDAAFATMTISGYQNTGHISNIWRIIFVPAIEARQCCRCGHGRTQNAGIKKAADTSAAASIFDLLCLMSPSATIHEL